MAHFSDINLLSLMEPLLLGLTWVVLMRARSYTRFPAFAAYLSCRLAVFAMLFAIFEAARLGLLDKYVAYTTYYYIYWTGYLVGAAMALLVIRSIFGRVIEPFQSLHGIGRAGFRWAAATSVLIAIVSALLPVGPNQDVLREAAGCVMRGVCVLELCLLAVVLLSMQTLRFSRKSREFGIAVGLAMIASAQLAASAFALRHAAMAAAASDASQVVVALAAVVWAGCFLRPAVEKSDVRSGESSTPLDRWHEVATAYAEPAPQVRLGSPAGGFFLEDVVKVVDRVMERNAASPER